MIKLLLSLCIGTSLVSATAHALTAEQSVLKEITQTTSNGNVVTTYEPATLVVPGETILYRLDFENDGSEPVTTMVLTMPVPAEVLYQDGTAQKDGANIVFSTDNAKTFSTRETLFVANDTGGFRKAENEDITHIRWQFEQALQPGDTGYLMFKGTLK